MRCISCDNDDVYKLRKMYISDVDKNIDQKSYYFICRNCFSGTQWLWDKSEKAKKHYLESYFREIPMKTRSGRISTR